MRIGGTMKVGLGEAIGFGRLDAATAKLVAACALIAAATAAHAATAPTSTKILTCKDANGKPIITDPSDPRCYKPPLTEPERAAAEEEKRKQVEIYNACKAEQRSLQSLLSRYPDKARHDAARQTALSQVEASMRLSAKRMEQLQAERKRLLDEAEFYPSGNLPTKLRRDLDANSAVIAAQTQAIANQRDEADQKNAFYDEELIKLKKLWLPRQAETRPCVAPRD
jgi:hypothetical protein